MLQEGLHDAVGSGREELLPSPRVLPSRAAGPSVAEPWDSCLWCTLL